MKLYALERRNAELEQLARELGYKSANLQILTQNSLLVPPHFGLSHQLCFDHLTSYAPEWIELWDKFKSAQQSETSGLAEGTHEILTKLRTLICKTFVDYPLPQEILKEYLSTNFSEDGYLMVRSTGKEDTEELANPGGNESYSGISPNVKDISEAVGKVIASYFSEKSLEQRLKSQKDDSISEKPFMPVLLQNMIREKPGSMVYSGVMYTGNRNTRIQVAPGHGELVVNSKGPVDSFFVTREGVVHQQIYQKPVRLVSVVEDNSTQLSLVQNSEELRRNPSLNISVVKRLREIGQKIEDLYGEPRDVEFIYDERSDNIYIVQARPIPKSLSQNYVPNAIAPEHIKKVKSQSTAMKAKIVTPATSTARIIKAENQIIIRNSISAALDDYLAMKEEANDVKAIIVHRDAPSTSHEAAQFNALCIPVFYMSKSDSSKVEALLKKEEPNLIFDTQRGLVVDWAGKNENEILKNGFFKSSNPPERTLTPVVTTFEIDEKLIEEAHSLIYQGGQGKLRKSGAFTHIEELIEEIESVKAGNVEAARESLGIILRYLYNLANQPSTNTSDLTYRKQELFRYACIYAANINHQLNEIANLTGNLPEEVQRELLDLVNGLEALITNPGRKYLFSDSLYQIILDNKARNELESPPWKTLFNKLPSSVKDDIIYLYRFGAFSANEKIRSEWIQFILEVGANSKKDRDQLDKLIECALYSTKNNLGSVLVNRTFHGFYAFYESPNFESVITPMVDMINRCKATLAKQNFWKLESKIAEYESKVSLWAKPRNYNELIEDFRFNFEAILEHFKRFGELNKVTLYARSRLIEEIEAFTEIIDASIKSMKGSPDYAKDRGTQAQRFSEMLSYYFKLMEWMVHSVPESKYQEWKAHILLNTSKSQMIERIKDVFEKRQSIVSSDDLEASGSLEVNSVVIDSPASFERQFMRFENNFTLEDFFTIFHQNILASLAAFTTGLALSEKDYPPVLHSFHKELFDKFETIKHMSTKLTGDVINSSYNIPLRNHAAKLIVLFNKSTNKIELQYEIYGHNAEGRMSRIATFTNMLMQKFMTQSDVIQHEEQAMFYLKKNSLLTKFVINANEFTNEHLTIINLMHNMASMTFDANSLDLEWFLSDFEPELQVNEKIEILALQRVWKKDQAQFFFKFLFDKIDQIDISNEKDLITIFLYPCSKLLEDQLAFCLLGGPNQIGTQREMYHLLEKFNVFPSLYSLRVNMCPLSDYLKLVTPDKQQQLRLFCQLVESSQQLGKIYQWDQEKTRFIFELLLSDEIDSSELSETQLQLLLNCFYTTVTDDINLCLSNQQTSQFCTFSELKHFSEKYSNSSGLLIGNLPVSDILATTQTSKASLTFKYGSENNAEPESEEQLKNPKSKKVKKL